MLLHRTLPPIIVVAQPLVGDSELEVHLVNIYQNITYFAPKYLETNPKLSMQIFGALSAQCDLSES